MYDSGVNVVNEGVVNVVNDDVVNVVNVGVVNVVKRMYDSGVNDLFIVIS